MNYTTELVPPLNKGGGQPLYLDQAVIDRGLPLALQEVGGVNSRVRKPPLPYSHHCAQVNFLEKGESESPSKPTQ